MPAGTEYIEIHNPLLFIDGVGNLVLDTQGKLAEQVAAANIPGFVGAGIPTQVTITNVAGGTQYYSLVTFQVSDVFGNAVKGMFNMDVLLSDAATGAGLTGTTATGGVTLTAGVTLAILTAAKAFRAQTDVNGKIVMQIIDSSKTGFYPVAAFGTFGYFVGKQLTTSSYHV